MWWYRNEFPDTHNTHALTKLYVVLPKNSWNLNANCVNDVRQTEIHTAEPLVPEPSAVVV